MNKAYIGFHVKPSVPEGPVLLICDELPEVALPFQRVYQPEKQSIDVLRGIDERRAEELSDSLYDIYPESTTLTVRNGRQDLRDALLKADRLEKVTGTEEVDRVIRDILFQPVVRNALCSRSSVFRIAKENVVVARLNRKEIGDKAALIIGLVLLNMYKAQVVVEDFGFYGRRAHRRLVREDRLIAQVNSLKELPEELRNSFLSIREREGKGVLFDDAETIAKLDGLRPGRNEFNDRVDELMSIKGH